VDDDATSRILLRQALHGYGEILMATNGLEAVKAVRAALEARTPYHLIFLDVSMPEMGGIEALTQIRALEREVVADPPVRSRAIMATGHADRDSVEQAVKAECDGYIVKPYDKGSILGHLKKLGLSL
jgi:two-component system, chemotaxis family, chemotaxis protein CheY